jgi:DNA polymerase V
LLIRAALFGLRHIYRKGYAYKKAGVILTGIDSVATYHESLLTQYGADEKSAKLMNVMDQLNHKYGRNTVSVFSVGSQKAWSMRREIMSPCYTTKWIDVPIAHAF